MVNKICPICDKEFVAKTKKKFCSIQCYKKYRVKYERDWKLINKDHVNEVNIRYRESHKEEKKNYRENHKKEIKQYNKKYNESYKPRKREIEKTIEWKLRRQYLNC